MKILYNIRDMHVAVLAARGQNRRLGFVPTMGALHEGHLSLVRAAKNQCAVVAASIFINPTQFGPNEDFSIYPRTFERDSELLKNEGVDLLFAPSAEEMYPKGAVTWVTVEGLSDKLDGRSRPGHFRGVTTVVSKLFHIIEPDVAFFGQKDAVQLVLIRRMVRDLNMPVEIVGCPIVRDADGLAMSSRNAFLSAEERKSATVLNRTLKEIRQRFDQGERSASKLLSSGIKIFQQEPGARLDYLEIVDPESLDATRSISKEALVAIAAHIGTTRLIDNEMLQSNLVV
jgi:pantoate--beta-alanine ligase